MVESDLDAPADMTLADRFREIIDEKLGLGNFLQWLVGVTAVVEEPISTTLFGKCTAMVDSIEETTMTCRFCEAKLVCRLQLTGGCSGDHGYDGCYCESADVHAEFYCPTPGCKAKVIKVSDLGDQFSIARWLTEHYTLSKDTKVMAPTKGWGSEWKEVSRVTKDKV